jgi:pilus assembly protein CpaF
MKISDRLSAKGPPREGPPRTPQAIPPAPDLKEVLAQLHAQVVDRLDMARVRQLDPAALRDQVGGLVQHLLVSQHLVLTDGQRERIVGTMVDEIVGLGPLEPVLADPTISDILVNTASKVYIERNGILELTDVTFRDNAHLLNTINRIVGRIGRRIDESSPMVDARLPDGSRVNAIIPPLAIDGPLLCIRRFGTGPTSPEDLVRGGTLTSNMTQFMACAVRSKCNILVAGGTGAGKTTLLNALSSFIGSTERIVTIEDSAELRLQQSHVGRLETRPPNIEGKGEVTIRDLVRNALRMRPDRIIVGEVRASEVLDMIQAMNTGHEGSMTTVHANSAIDAATRLMTMLGMAGTQLSEPMMLQMIARAMHLVVFVARFTDGRRRVSTIAEVQGVADGELRLHEVFKFEQRGVDSQGRVEGRFVCSGRSYLLDRFSAAGVPLHPACLGAQK